MPKKIFASEWDRTTNLPVILTSNSRTR